MAELARFAGEGIKAGEVWLKEESDAIGRAIALFGDIKLTGKTPHVGGGGAIFILVTFPAVFGLTPGGFAAKEKDKIGVLFNGAGFAQVVEGRFGVGFLRFSIELGEDDDGNFQLHGEGLEATGDFGNFDLAVFFAAAGAGGEELKIVDNENINSVLFFNAAGAGPELPNGEKTGFV